MAIDTLNRESSHLANPTLLRKIDELREKNIGQHVPLPQLVVVGDQSSGKSSLLESLTNIPFPRNLELCTRYATQITSRRDLHSQVDITIIPGPHASDAHRKHLEEYHPGMLSPEVFRVVFPRIIKEVNIRMGIRTDTSSSDGNVFSEDVLKVEICGPNEDYLTLIDVPGIFRTPTEGITTKKDIKLVQNMVKGYIKDKRTVILAVLPSNVDPATQEILTLAEDYDKAGERTLGVLTKPDLVTELSAQAAVCNVVLGKKKPLALGYYVIRNRGADDDDNFDRLSVEQLFREKPWSALPADRLGVQALKTRLSELLGQITRREFPELRKDVKKQLIDCQRELDSLGPARQTEQEQRLFLSTVSRQFQELVQAALNAHYYSHSAFEESGELKLITHVVNLTERFNSDFDEKAQLRYFEPQSNNDTEEDADDSEEVEENTWADVSAKQELVDDVDLEDPVLENIITKDYDFDYPQDGIMDWLEGLYLRSRGVELGTFGGAILSSAFKEQSSKWEIMTKVYVSNVIIVIHRFMIITLKMLCTDVRVHEEIWSSVLDEVLNRYRAAVDQAMFLVSIEREKRPYTLNHYFNKKLQVSRGNRMAAMLKGKARKELQPGPFGKGVVTSENLIVDLDSVRHSTTSKSNVEHIKEEIHDILWSYYKVARKRFVDNIYHQAIDHCLLTGPMSPLAVFSQEWVIKLEAEQLETIAGESPTTKERRTTLVKKIHDLEVAMRILRH
ncbi:putative dynamin [Talaromyces proteolyticus]|uniref:Dynamin n=1 Tax=Talaromyces proteolyticus TaxID=1131652 RepID=A0AAD4L154_9EURO|nr:putative dynamin [Talaromyces proteolyticus]KAH8704700.1 putative dynamin [Talaromyces proteolyticus]